MAAKPALLGSDQNLLNYAQAAAAGNVNAQFKPGAAPVTQDQAQSKIAQDVYNLVYGQAAPQLSLIDANVAQMGTQLGVANAKYAEQMGWTQKESGLQQQLLGLQNQALGIQSGALGRQRPLLDQLRLLQQQEFKRQGEELNVGHATNLEQMNAANAAQGSLFTHGAYRARSNEDFAFNRAGQRLGAAQKEAALTYNEKVAQLSDESKNLTLAAKRLGINKDLLYVKTQEALTQLGLDRIMTVSQVIQAMNDAEIGKFNVLNGVASTVSNVLNTPGTFGVGTSKGVYNPGGGPAIGGSLASWNGGIQNDAIRNDWSTEFLKRAGFPVTPENLKFMNAWQKAESGGGGGKYNPLNTTQGGFPSTNLNSVGVKNYTNANDGFSANIKVLNNGYYGAIINALRSGNSAMGAARALASTPWGTGSLVIRILGG